MKMFLKGISEGFGIFSIYDIGYYIADLIQFSLKVTLTIYIGLYILNV